MVPATLGTKSSGPCSPTMASCRAAIRPPVAKARMLDDVDALPMPELDVICAAAAPAFAASAATRPTAAPKLPSIESMPLIKPCTKSLPSWTSNAPRFPNSVKTLDGMPPATPTSRPPPTPTCCTRRSRTAPAPARSAWKDPASGPDRGAASVVAVTHPLDRADLRARVGRTLGAFLAAKRQRLAAVDDALLPLADAIEALVLCGGKRLRPAFAYWGYRAAGGPDADPVVGTVSALELVQASALIHDDVMD